MVDRLWESIEGEEAREHLELASEHENELLRRLKSIEDGSAVLLDGAQVIQDLRARFSVK